MTFVPAIAFFTCIAFFGEGGCSQKAENTCKCGKTPLFFSKRDVKSDDGLI